MWEVAMAALIGTLGDWVKLLIAGNCRRVIKGIYIYIYIYVYVYIYCAI